MHLFFTSLVFCFALWVTANHAVLLLNGYVLRDLDAKLTPTRLVTVVAWALFYYLTH